MLQNAIAELQKFPYLLELARVHIILLIDHLGTIQWVYLPNESHPHTQFIQCLMGGRIEDFYDFGKMGFPGKPGPSAPDFPSKNNFEQKAEDLNFETQVPLSRIMLREALEGWTLGIIMFNEKLLLPLRLQADRKNDFLLMADRKDRLIGFSRNLAEKLGGKAPSLGTPLGEFIDLLFRKSTLPKLPRRLSEGERMFEFSRKRRDPVEFSDPALFRINPKGLQADTAEAPGFIRLVAGADFRTHDFSIEAHVECIRGEPPFFILCGVPLNKAMYPDSSGFFLGPLVGRNASGDRAQQVLKFSGDMLRLFDAPPIRPDRSLDFLILKRGQELRYFINGKGIGTFPLNSIFLRPDAGAIITGLRKRQSCLFSRLRVTRHSLSRESPGDGPGLTSFFRRDPSRPFSVYSEYLPTDHPGDLNLLRLEDLSAREELSRYIQEVNRKEAELKRLKRIIYRAKGVAHIVGEHPGMEKLRTVIKSVADSNAVLFLTGETGTGKSLIARAVHEESDRRNRPFITLDCSTLPESLMESELFGFVKGAFTGAHSDHPGRFEQAHTGTLFLDEIGNIPLHVQSKLLNVLQDFTIQRLGGAASIPLDVRLITATNSDLKALIEAGKFRRDLFYRLNVLEFKIPPLRERLEDIPALCEHFLNTDLTRYNHPVERLSPGVYDRLMGYSWPGNVRELFNVLLKAVVLCKNSTLQPADIALPETNAVAPAEMGPGGGRAGRRLAAEQVMDELRKCRGNIRWTAENLGISRVAVYQKLRKAGVNPKSLRRSIRLPPVK